MSGAEDTTVVTVQRFADKRDAEDVARLYFDQLCHGRSGLADANPRGRVQIIPLVRH